MRFLNCLFKYSRGIFAIHWFWKCLIAMRGVSFFLLVNSLPYKCKSRQLCCHSFKLYILFIRSLKLDYCIFIKSTCRLLLVFNRTSLFFFVYHKKFCKLYNIIINNTKLINITIIKPLSNPIYIRLK